MRPWLQGFQVLCYCGLLLGFDSGDPECAPGLDLRFTVRQLGIMVGEEARYFKFLGGGLFSASGLKATA